MPEQDYFISPVRKKGVDRFVSKKKETVTGVTRYATITIAKSLTLKKPERKTGLKGFEPLTCGLRVRRYAELK